MPLLRSFVFGLSGRAGLAVAALALAVAYAVIAAGAMAGLETTSRTIEDAQAEPGWLIVAADGGAFDADLAPDGAASVRSGIVNGTLVATIAPWPHDDQVFIGPHAPSRSAGPSGLVAFANVTWNTTVIDRAPVDGWFVPPDRFDVLLDDHDGRVVAAYVAGTSAPVVSDGLVVVAWTGVDGFYREGARELVGALVLLVVAVSVVAGLLASQFVRLEVLARRGELRTLAALGGVPLVRRVVIGRTLALVGAATVLGLGMALTAFVVARTVGAGSFRPDLFVSALIACLTLLVAATAGIVGGLLALRQESGTSGGSRVRRVPGPVRFLGVTPRLSAGILAATIMAVAVLTGVLQTSAVPSTLFGTPDDGIAVVQAEANPLRGRADLFLGEQARDIPGVAAGWPETYAPTTIDGAPVLIKGVHLDSWRAGTTGHIMEGRWPASVGEASVGFRAADRLGLEIGDTRWVPHSYHHGASSLRIVGIHATGGLEDDELITTSETAGRLAGLPAHQATMVRIRPEVPGTPWSALAPSAGIEIVSMIMDPAQPEPHTPFSLQVRAINFAGIERERPISVRIDGNVTAQAVLSMPARSITDRTFDLVAPGSGFFEVEVNPTLRQSTSFSALSVALPDVARPGERFALRVFDETNTPVAGASVAVAGGASNRTDAEGRATLVVDDASLVTVTAESSQRRGGAPLRVAPAVWDRTSELVVEHVFVGNPQRVSDERVRVPITVTLANLGGRDASQELEWAHDDDVTSAVEVDVASAARATFSVTVATAPGDHTFSVLGHNATYRVGARADADVSDARTIEDALSAFAASQERRAQTGADAASRFLDRTFSDIGTVSSVVVIATLVHTGSLVWVAVVREVRERRAVLDSLRAFGADAFRVEGRVLRDTLFAVLPVLVLGTVVAAFGLSWAHSLGWPRAFGHTLPVKDAWVLQLRVATTILVIALLAGFYATHSGRARTSGLHGSPAVGDALRRWRR